MDVDADPPSQESAFDETGSSIRDDGQRPESRSSMGSISLSNLSSRKRISTRAIDTSMDKEIISVKMSKNKFINACVKMVTVDGRPFAAMDDEGFRDIINPMMEGFSSNVTMSAKTITNLVHRKAEEITNSIADKFKNKLLNLKFDAATRLDRKFIGINIQEIVGEKIEISCLGVIEVSESHTAENLAKCVIECLGDFNLRVEQIFSFTVDNGRNVVLQATCWTKMCVKCWHRIL